MIKKYIIWQVEMKSRAVEIYSKPLIYFEIFIFFLEKIISTTV